MWEGLPLELKVVNVDMFVFGTKRWLVDGDVGIT